jgi:hypothetical protein
LTAGGRSRVVVGQYPGNRYARGTRVVIVNRAIHTGDVFASLGSGMAILQSISGVVMWWKKKRAFSEFCGEELCGCLGDSQMFSDTLPHLFNMVGSLPKPTRLKYLLHLGQRIVPQWGSRRL